MSVKKKTFATFCIFFYIIFNTIRGELGFHSIAYWSMTSLLIAIYFNRLISERVKLNNVFFKKIIIFFQISIVFTVILVPFFRYNHSILLVNPLTNLNSKKNLQEISPPKDYAFYARNLLNINEGFFTTSIYPNRICYLESGRLPSIKAGSVVPWLTDIFEDDIISQLEQKKTKLIFYNPNDSVWGYVLKDYAQKLNSYIALNYRDLELSLADIFVRNDFYNEAVAKLRDLNDEDFLYTFSDPLVEPHVPLAPMWQDNYIKQTFVSKRDSLSGISILLSTYMRKNNSLLEFTIYYENQVLTQIIDASNLIDNEYKSIFFPKLIDSENKKVVLEIKAIKASQGNVVTAWKSNSDQYKEGILELNGTQIPGGLAMRLIYPR